MGEKIRAKLVGLKKAHPDDSAGVTTCFQTMQKYLANVYRDPSQEKFRSIRVSNPAFQQRVGAFTGSFDILELCGFKASPTSRTSQYYCSLLIKLCFLKLLHNGCTAIAVTLNNLDAILARKYWHARYVVHPKSA